MAFKPNYNQQRAERNRLKQAKKDAKLREREDAAARRKADPDGAPPDATEPDSGTPDSGTSDPGKHEAGAAGAVGESC
jgi:hypothetical protein